MYFIYFILLCYCAVYILPLNDELKLDYKETKYPLVNVYDEGNIVKKVTAFFSQGDCRSLIDLYNKIPKDKVFRAKLNKREGYYYARYIGVKDYIWWKIIDLFNKKRCENLGFNSIFRVFDNRTIKRRALDLLESGNIEELTALVEKEPSLQPILKLLVPLNKKKSVDYIEKSNIQSNSRKVRSLRKLKFEHAGTIQLDRCYNTKSFTPKYPTSEFFIKIAKYIVFFDNGNMYIFDTEDYTNEMLNLYDSFKIETDSHPFVETKDILGVENKGYRLYITIFNGKFYSGKTIERLGINESEEHIFRIPTYKLMAFDLYYKKVLWESQLPDDMSFLSAPTQAGGNLYAMCGEFSNREMIAYMCKLDIKSGKVIEKIYIMADEIGAIAKHKKTIISFEYSKPYKDGNYLYVVLYTGGIVAKYDFYNDFIKFVIRLRTSDILPLPINFKGESMWIGKNTLLFFNSDSHNFFAVNKNNGRLISAISRNIVGQALRKCFVLYDTFTCLSKKGVFIFSDKNIKVINYKVDNMFVDDNRVYIVKDKTIYFVKNLFLSIIQPIFDLNNKVKIDELSHTYKYLFLKTKRKDNCYVEIYYKNRVIEKNHRYKER